MSEYTHYTHKTHGFSETDGANGLSIHGQSTLRTENALSEIESALSGKAGPMQNEALHSQYPLSNAFFQTAGVLIDLGHHDDAQRCLEEAQKVMSG